jgi:hypothetical protein
MIRRLRSRHELGDLSKAAVKAAFTANEGYRGAESVSEWVAPALKFHDRVLAIPDAARERIRQEAAFRTEAAQFRELVRIMHSHGVYGQGEDAPGAPGCYWLGEGTPPR